LSNSEFNKTIFLTTSPAIISPATGGTKATLIETGLNESEHTLRIETDREKAKQSTGHAIRTGAFLAEK
jgi:hypothetical protein